MKNYSRIMEGEAVGELFKALSAEDPRRQTIERAKEIGRERIYVDIKKLEIELGCASTFDTLLGEFCTAATLRAKHLKHDEPMGWKASLIMKLLADHAPTKDNSPNGAEWTEYQCLRRMIDYVSGMTDNFAIYVAQQLRGVGFSGRQRP